MKKLILGFGFFIALLYAGYLKMPAVFFLISLVFLTIDYISQRDEYLEGRKFYEKIRSIHDFDERIKFMSGYSEEWLALYYEQMKLKNELLLNIEETLLEWRMCEVHASEEKQKTAAYVYKALLKFKGKKCPYLD